MNLEELLETTPDPTLSVPLPNLPEEKPQVSRVNCRGVFRGIGGFLHYLFLPPSILNPGSFMGEFNQILSIPLSR